MVLLVMNRNIQKGEHPRLMAFASCQRRLLHYYSRLLHPGSARNASLRNCTRLVEGISVLPGDVPQTDDETTHVEEQTFRQLEESSRHRTQRAQPLPYRRRKQGWGPIVASLIIQLGKLLWVSSRTRVAHFVMNSHHGHPKHGLLQRSITAWVLDLLLIFKEETKPLRISS